MENTKQDCTSGLQGPLEQSGHPSELVLELVGQIPFLNYREVLKHKSIKFFVC